MMFTLYRIFTLVLVTVFCSYFLAMIWLIFVNDLQPFLADETEND